MEELNTEELIDTIHEYVKDNYDYEYADKFEDEVYYHLEDKRIFIVKVKIDYDREV